MSSADKTLININTDDVEDIDSNKQPLSDASSQFVAFDIVDMILLEVNSEEEYTLIINSDKGKQLGFDKCTIIKSSKGKFSFCYTDSEKTRKIPNRTIRQIKINNKRIQLKIKHKKMAYPRSLLSYVSELNF